MAERGAGKAKKAVKKAPGRTLRTVREAERPRARAEGLDEECARLRAELAAAEARIKALETDRKALLDRINWAIDSLSSLRDT